MKYIDDIENGDELNHMVCSSELDNMNISELGDLFPIVIVDYDPFWTQKYQEEKSVIERAVGPADIYMISHIGSTAVPGLAAKPTIDILLQIRETADPTRICTRLIKEGYLYSFQPDNPPPSMMFMKGYTQYGFSGQAVHLHVRYPGDWDELYFCEYLQRHPEVVQQYALLKYRLKDQFEHDREKYTEAKTEFIRSAVKLAREEYKDL